MIPFPYGAYLRSGTNPPDTMTVEVASGYLYARFPWDATYDAVQRVTVTAVSASATANGCVQPTGIKLIPIATAREDIATAYNAAAGAQTIAGQTDDAPPVKYNNHFMGGNHGVNAVKRITATAHGKTVGDIGSEWTNGTVTFCLMAIIDANTLWMLSANTNASAERWGFNTTLAASGTLTHVAGATNTGNITWSAQVTAQLYPCVQDHVRTIKLNGLTEVTVDGVYDCRYVTVEESYGIANPVSLRSWLIAGRPWASTPAMNDSAVATQVELSHVYRIEDNGSMSIVGSFNNLQTLDMSTGDGYVGFAQSQPIFYTSGIGESLWFYAPRVIDVAGFDAQSTEDVSGAISQVDYTAARWTESTNPPDRMVQFVKDSGINLRGYAMGYSRLSGVGADMDNYVVKSGYITTAKKMYVHCLTKQAPAFGAPASTLPINSAVSAVAYRCPYNLEATPEATTVAVRLDSTTGGAEIVLDFHQNVSAYAIPVPAKLNGKTVSIVDSNGNLSLDAATVANGEIVVTVINGYGAAVLSAS